MSIDVTERQSGAAAHDAHGPPDHRQSDCRATGAPGERRSSPPGPAAGRPRWQDRGPVLERQAERPGRPGPHQGEPGPALPRHPVHRRRRRAGWDEPLPFRRSAGDARPRRRRRGVQYGGLRELLLVADARSVRARAPGHPGDRLHGRHLLRGRPLQHRDLRRPRGLPRHRARMLLQQDHRRDQPDGRRCHALRRRRPDHRPGRTSTICPSSIG